MISNLAIIAILLTYALTFAQPLLHTLVPPAAMLAAADGSGQAAATSRGHVRSSLIRRAGRNFVLNPIETKHSHSAPDSPEISPRPRRAATLDQSMVAPTTPLLQKAWKGVGE
jgi:hypothetical protein